MQYGVTIFPTDYSISPGALAAAAEERGFDSLWFPEHSHIPTSRLSPWPGGGELPKPYYDCFDPLVSLCAAAAATGRIRLCTGICLVVQRDPIQLAKEIATLDQLSGGRVIMGVGGGWNAEEMADHGTEFKTRFALMAERIAAMKLIWTEKEPAFEGRYVNFGPMMAWPKPVQSPHPPILVGGGFPHGARRAIAYGDGWMPLGGRGADVVAQLPQFRQMAAEAGREPDGLQVTIFGAEQDDGQLARYSDAGVGRCVFMLPSADADTVLPLLDRLAALAGRQPTFAPARYAAEHSETAWLADRALDHLARHDDAAPFCLHVSFLRPHPPFIAPPVYHDLYHPYEMTPPLRAADAAAEAAQHPFLARALERVPQRVFFNHGRGPAAALGEAEVRQIRATYYALISQLDAQIGRLVAALGPQAG